MKKLLLPIIAMVALQPLAFAATIKCGDILRKVAASNLGHVKGLEQQAVVSFDKILTNISPSDARAGAIIAAQTRQNPNYYYHWVRDAGLVVESLIGKYQGASTTAEKGVIRSKIEQYIEFSDYIQRQNTLTGLGEPKFNVDGSTFNDPWGRPQNDSPAIRASSLIQWFHIAEKEKVLSKGLRQKLYDNADLTKSVIKRDLDYVANHWRDPSFDLWEEVKGDHFYTLMVQRRSMIEGAELARASGDIAGAEFYQSQVKDMEQAILGFWDEGHGYFVATKNRVAGFDYKKSGLDIAIVLGMLHGSLDDGFLEFSDPRIQATIKKLEHTFDQLYPINKNPKIPGVAIGRYPEDRYGGSHIDYGNPWPLCTLAIAEAKYKTAEELGRKGLKTKAQQLIAEGDEYVARVEVHKYPDGSLSEQMDRNSGYMTSVENLTWNYAAILTTQAAKNKALKIIGL